MADLNEPTRKAIVDALLSVVLKDGAKASFATAIRDVAVATKLAAEDIQAPLYYVVARLKGQGLIEGSGATFWRTSAPADADKKAFSRKDIPERIYTFVKDAEKPLKAKDICEGTGVSLATTMKYLKELCYEKRLKRDDKQRDTSFWCERLPNAKK